MNIAVILAGGVGSRLGLNRPKQFMKIAGKTVLEHTVEIFQRHSQIDEIAIVMHTSYVHDVEEMVIKNHWAKVKKVLNGGQERYESSMAAINAYRKQAQTGNINLIFHDAVRPLVSMRIISDVIEALNAYDAVDVAVPAVDTIIKLDETKKYIDQIPNRNYLNRGQTPQAFKYEIIEQAYQLALQDKNLQTTDDCGIIRKYLPDIKVYVVAGEEQNIKLTYPEDVYVLEKLFQIKGTAPNEKITLDKLMNKIIVVFGGNSGIGLDIIKIAKQYGAKCYSFSRSTTNTDISDFLQVQKALRLVIEKENRIDCVVNTAAVLNKEPLMHLKEETINKIIEINYNGMVNVTTASYKYLKESKGQILHFTSSSYTRGRANYALYSSTKAAVVNFVQAVSEEWQQDGIKINCINPQRTKTPMRTANFGIEDEKSLLKSEDVAKVSLKTLLSNFSGEVVDIKL